MDFAPVARLALLLIRPGVLIATAPVFGPAFAPPMVRVGMVMLITLALAPVVPLPEAGGIGITAIAIRETLIGLALTFSIRVLIAGAELGGNLAGFQLGFSYATLVDPQSGARNPLVAALFANVALLVFLGINGHHQMLQALASSYAALPIGAGAVGGKDLAGVVTDTLGSVFLIGVRIAAPVVLVLLVVEVAMALATRAMPQLNLMVIGAPVRLLVGLFVLGVTLAAVPEVVLMAVEPALRLAARLASAVAPH